MNYDTAIKTLTQVKEPPPGTTPHALYDAIATAILSMAHCQYLGVTKFETEHLLIGVTHTARLINSPNLHQN